MQDCSIPDSFQDVDGVRMRPAPITPIAPTRDQFQVSQERLQNRLEKVGENPEHLKGCFVWLSVVNDPENHAVPRNTPGVRIHHLENPALYSRGVIMQADTEDTLVKWDELSGGPTSTKTYSLLALATLISTTPALGWKGREGDANQDRADLRAFIFGGRNEQAEHCYADIVTTVDYAGLPRRK